MSLHIGRSFTGHTVEDACPCPQEPCGLIDQTRTSTECEHHAFWAAKTIRQAHSAGQCEGVPHD